jgi:uncharacterized integral membrane protein
MRWIYLGIIILFAAVTIIFALQNFDIVTMSLLGFNARVPLALVVAIAYLLGAATGGQPVGAAAPIVPRLKATDGGSALVARVTRTEGTVFSA